MAQDDFGRELTDTTCSECGQACQVPFKPTEGKPVYCRDCYRKRRPPRRDDSFKKWQIIIGSKLGTPALFLSFFLFWFQHNAILMKSILFLLAGLVILSGCVNEEKARPSPMASTTSSTVATTLATSPIPLSVYSTTSPIPLPLSSTTGVHPYFGTFS